MRVLYCIPTMGNGGGERQLAYLARGLAKCGVEVHVALMSRGATYEQLTRSGAVIHELPISRTHSPRLFSVMRRLLVETKPQIVQTWFVQMDIIGGSLAVAASLPWIISERSCVSAYERSIKAWIRQWLGRCASAVIANSDGGAEYWRKRLRGSDRIHIIQNALPLDEIARAVPADANETGVKTGQAMILYAGRLSPEKNLHVLLRALELAVKQCRCVAILCGSGLQEQQLRRWIDDRGHAQEIIMAGHVSDIWGWMKRADVFVSVSSFEGQPNSVMEAMACGVPLVLSDIPAHRELLDPSSARFVTPADPVAVSTAIVEAITEREAAFRRAERAKELAQEWSINSMVSNYINLYERILGRKGGMESEGSSRSAAPKATRLDRKVSFSGIGPVSR